MTPGLILGTVSKQAGTNMDHHRVQLNLESQIEKNQKKQKQNNFYIQQNIVKFTEEKLF